MAWKGRTAEAVTSAARNRFKCDGAYPHARVPESDRTVVRLRVGGDIS